MDEQTAQAPVNSPAPAAPQMSDDDHAAALGFITTLSEHMFHQAPEESPQDQSQQGPTGTVSDMPLEKEKPDLKAMETSIMSELSNMKDLIQTEMKPNDVQKEIESIRKELTGLLESNDEPSKDS